MRPRYQTLEIERVGRFDVSGWTENTEFGLPEGDPDAPHWSLVPLPTIGPYTRAYIVDDTEWPVVVATMWGGERNPYGWDIPLVTVDWPDHQEVFAVVEGDGDPMRRLYWLLGRRHANAPTPYLDEGDAS